MNASELHELVKGLPAEARPRKWRYWPYADNGWWKHAGGEELDNDQIVMLHESAALRWLTNLRTDNGAYVTVEHLDGGFGWEATYKARPQIRIVGRGPTLLHALVVAVRQAEGWA